MFLTDFILLKDLIINIILTTSTYSLPDMDMDLNKNTIYQNARATTKSALVN